MIKNIIFDMGNVLVDFCWQKTFEEKGITGRMLERVADATVRNKDWDEFDLANIPHDQIIQNFIENDPEIEQEIRIATSSIGDMIKKKAYAENLITALQKAGYSVYILSNMSPEAFAEAGEDLKCAELADGALFSCECHLVKPDLRIYQLLLEKFSLCASESVFLDDKLENVEAGENCGIKGIVFTDIEDALYKLKCMGIEVELC